MIAVGQALPPATFRVATADGIVAQSTADVFAGKSVVLFAVPGAFTPTCHQNHLPGFLEHADAIRAAGVDTIAVTSTNDAFVMKAWASATGATDTILFLADGNGDFAKATGMDVDGSAGGMGVRSKRYAMVVRDGVVRWLGVEENRGVVDLSGAPAVLAALRLSDTP